MKVRNILDISTLKELREWYEANHLNDGTSKIYKSHIIVDFADAPESLWEAVDRIPDRNNFFMQLQFIYGVKLYERDGKSFRINQKYLQSIADNH